MNEEKASLSLIKAQQSTPNSHLKTSPTDQNSNYFKETTSKIENSQIQAQVGKEIVESVSSVEFKRANMEKGKQPFDVIEIEDSQPKWSVFDSIRQLTPDSERRMKQVLKFNEERSIKKSFSSPMSLLCEQIRTIRPDSAKRLKFVVGAEQERKSRLETRKKEDLDKQLQFQKVKLKQVGFQKLEETREVKDRELFSIITATRISSDIIFDEGEDFDELEVEGDEFEVTSLHTLTK